MKLSALFTEEDAQSEVIGVVLIVAVVVFLIGAVATAVFSLAGQMGADQPRADFTFAFNSSSTDHGCDMNGGGNLTDDGNPAMGELNVTHDGGAAIDGTRLTITSRASGSSVEFAADCNVSRVTPGSSASVLVDSDDTVRVVWESESGGSTIVLEKWTAPDS